MLRLLGRHLWRAQTLNLNAPHDGALALKQYPTPTWRRPMRFRITIRTAHGIKSIPVIGDRNELLDAAYDASALGVTLVPEL